MRALRCDRRAPQLLAVALWPTASARWPSGTVMSAEPAPGPRTRGPWWLFAAAGLTTLALSLAITEIALRWSGFVPLHPCPDADEPVLYEPDPVLGWKPKPGAYQIPSRDPRAPATQMTILDDGARATGQPGSDGPAVVLVGCSFTQGVGISDAETYAWKLQQRYPSWRVRNFAAGAYGTYQALGTLERVFSEPDPPRKVFYGFIEPHEMRNIAHPVWLRILSLCSRRGMVATPYCTLADDGTLTRHAPESYWLWPFQRRLATIAFLQDRYAAFATRHRTAQGRRVTELLLLEMNALAERHGAELYVVMFYSSAAGREHYKAFLAQHAVRFIDCALPITPDMAVPGDGHPNGALNSAWVECIASAIETTDR
jgi:hypothetical protein